MQQADLSIIKFTENNIEMINHNTKKIYRYVEPQRLPTINNSSQLHQQISHPLFIQAIPLGPGYLYPKQISTMHSTIQQRQNLLKASPKQYQHQYYFTQQQLDNTFNQLIKYFITNEQNKLQNPELTQYGQLNMKNILIDQEGQIRLQNKILCSNTINNNINNNNKYTNDIKQLGIILLQCCLLQLINNNNNITYKQQQYYYSTDLKSIINILQNKDITDIKYSNKLISKIYILANNMVSMYQCIITSDDNEINTNKQYNELLEQIDRIKQEQLILNSNINNNMKNIQLVDVSNGQCQHSILNNQQQTSKSQKPQKQSNIKNTNMKNNIRNKKSAPKKQSRLIKNQNKKTNTNTSNSNSKTNNNNKCIFRNRIIIPPLNLLEDRNSNSSSKYKYGDTIKNTTATKYYSKYGQKEIGYIKDIKDIRDIKGIRDISKIKYTIYNQNNNKNNNNRNKCQDYGKYQ